MTTAVLLNDTRSVAHHGCSRVMDNLDLMLHKLGINVIDRCYVDNDWSSNEQLMRNIKLSDCLVINGEGTIHHDAPAGIELLKGAKFAKLSGSKVLLLNCTFDSNSLAVKDYLAFCDLISVRESWSQHQLEDFDISASLVPDFSFYHWPALQISDRSGVGFTCSVDKRLKHKYQKHIPSDAIYLPIQYDVAATGNKAANKKPFHRRVNINLLNNLVYLIQDHVLRRQFEVWTHENYKEYMKAISGLDVLITGRFHAACFAIMTCTPVLAVQSNTHKIEALFHDVGLCKKRLVRDDNNEFEKLRTRSAPFSNKELNAIQEYRKMAKEKFVELEKSIEKLITKQ